MPLVAEMLVDFKNGRVVALPVLLTIQPQASMSNLIYPLIMIMEY